MLEHVHDIRMVTISIPKTAAEFVAGWNPATDSEQTLRDACREALGLYDGWTKATYNRKPGYHCVTHDRNTTECQPSCDMRPLYYRTVK